MSGTKKEVVISNDLIEKLEEAREKVLRLADWLELNPEDRKVFSDTGNFSQLIEKARKREKISSNDLRPIWQTCRYLDHSLDNYLMGLSKQILLTIGLQLMFENIKALRGVANILASQPHVADYRFNPVGDFSPVKIKIETGQILDKQEIDLISDMCSYCMKSDDKTTRDMASKVMGILVL